MASHACQFQIGLLGPFYLVVDQEQVSEKVWKSKKAFTLLKYLAARQGHKVSSDVLIELLWPDNEDVDSTANLHTAVWFVRRILTSKEDPDAESRLRYSNGAYWLDLENGCIDVGLFEHHARMARQLTETDPETALMHCDSALELYRDDFLSEDVYDEWTISYREDYQELYFEVVVGYAELLMKQRDDLHAAIKILRDAVKRDPYREELYQTGIKAYILSGRSVDAINLYERYSKMLMDEFQLEPSQATKDLIVKLKEMAIEKESSSIASGGADPRAGAYVCSRKELQFTLNTERRRLGRGGNNFALLLAANLQGSVLQGQLRTVFHILQRSTRNSDLICQFSANLVVLLLLDTNLPHSKAIWQRMKQVLREQKVDTSNLSLTLLNSEHLEEMGKNLVSILAQ